MLPPSSVPPVAAWLVQRKIFIHRHRILHSLIQFGLWIALNCSESIVSPDLCACIFICKCITKPSLTSLNIPSAYTFWYNSTATAWLCPLRQLHAVRQAKNFNATQKRWPYRKFSFLAYAIMPMNVCRGRDALCLHYSFSRKLGELSFVIISSSKFYIWDIYL